MITGNDGYQNFLVFVPILKSLILDSNVKVTNWINISLQQSSSNLANGRVTLKFNNSNSKLKFLYKLVGDIALILLIYIGFFSCALTRLAWKFKSEILTETPLTKRKE